MTSDRPNDDHGAEALIALFTGLFVLGSMFSLAAYGSEGRQKKTYRWIAVGLWLLLLVLGNIIL